MGCDRMVDMERLGDVMCRKDWFWSSVSMQLGG